MVARNGGNKSSGSSMTRFENCAVLPASQKCFLSLLTVDLLKSGAEELERWAVYFNILLNVDRAVDLEHIHSIP